MAVRRTRTETPDRKGRASRGDGDDSVVSATTSIVIVVSAAVVSVVSVATIITPATGAAVVIVVDLAVAGVHPFDVVIVAGVARFSESSGLAEGLGVGLGVGRPDGVLPESSMMIVSRGAGSSAADATKEPATNAPRGSTRARARTTFNQLRMGKQSCLMMGRR